MSEDQPLLLHPDSESRLLTETVWETLVRFNSNTSNVTCLR